MTIENDYEISLKDFPLCIDTADVYRIYLRCLNFIEAELFEIVHEKKKKHQAISAYDLISNGLSPILSSKSLYGVCLRPLKNTEFYKKTQNKRVVLSPINLVNLNEKIKIIKSIDELDSYCLIPRENLHLFEYKLIISSFIKLLS